MQPVYSNGNKIQVKFGPKVKFTKIKIKLDGVGLVDNKPSTD